MVEPSRYNVANEEGEDVLPNKLGISDLKSLQDAETILFADTFKYFLIPSNVNSFDVKLIFSIHTYCFGTLYKWAGKIRTVEISKGGTLFCPSSQIEKELKMFDHLLEENLPLLQDSKKIISEKLAIIHCEFNAIHPFREGNGRTIRLFLDLLALNAGLKLIDYSKTSQENYIEACIAGMLKDYSKMEEVIFKGLDTNK